VVQLLLAAAPNTVAAASQAGYLPLHAAAQRGHAAVVQLLLKAAPNSVSATSQGGQIPLHLAAHAGHAAVVQVLLMAAPSTVSAADQAGWLPLHFAARAGHAAVVQRLLAAAPETGAACDSRSQLAMLRLVLGPSKHDVPIEQRLAAARCLLAANPSLNVLPSLAGAGPWALPLFADFVLCRTPLTAEEWAWVPAPCPGLGRALPPVLAHSEEQAGQLVRCLPAEEARRLRTFALCLARRQLELGVFLAQPVFARILSLFDT